MKNRSNITEPAAHSSIMSGKQLLQAHKYMFLSLCVYLYMSRCMHMCMYIYACECVCALAMLWLLLRYVCYLFPSRYPISHPEAANGNVSFLAEVRNWTLASMWFELGPPKLWRTPRMTWGTCRPNSILLNGGEKSSPESSEIFWRSSAAIKTGRKPITQWIMGQRPMKSLTALSHPHANPNQLKLCWSVFFPK